MTIIIFFTVKVSFTAITHQILVCFWASAPDPNGIAYNAPPYLLDDWEGRFSLDPSQLSTKCALIPSGA